MSWRQRDFRRLMRGLRFRVTAAYGLFFALLLIGVAGLFRERLASSLDNQVLDLLNTDWDALKGYLRIEETADLGGKPSASWYYDKDDSDETTIVLDLQKVYLIADQYGHVIPATVSKDPAVSTAYDDLGIDRPADIAARVREALEASRPSPRGGRSSAPAKTFWMQRRSSTGEPYMIRAGIVYDERHTAPFYVAIGMSYADNAKILNRQTWIYAGVILSALIFGSLLGWIVAGRALTPVKDVAEAAQRISGSNLSLRIPSRQADDELDYLILTFNRMIDRLEASFRQMKQFSADVSHELRTPITAIRGQLEVALFTARTVDHYREAMFNALQDIDRLSQIVRALLLLSQAESGQLALQNSPLNLSALAEDLTDQFQIPAEAAGITLTADLQPECIIQADRVQIERMITNLLSNALKFTPEGGKVRVSVRHAESQVELSVEDTGCGIAPEYVPHIFDRFYRVPGSGTAPTPEQGLGLGLSFVAWIVQAHGGVVDVQSTPGQGTRFTVQFPAGAPAHETPQLTREAAGRA